MRLALVLAALALVALPRPAAADTALSEQEVLYGCGKPKGPFAVALRPEVDLKELATWAMGFTCKKLLYASSIAGRSAKVTMLTPGTLTASEAWGLFQAALHGMGLAVVPKGAALEIVESVKAKDEALAILKEFPDGGADVVRLLLRPEHVAVDDLRAALELVKSQHGAVAALPNLHALLVTDRASHVARMKTLVTELDRPAAGDAVFAIPLRHVPAATVTPTIEKLLAGKEPLRLVADERTNTLFLAGTAADHARAAALANALDLDTGDDAKVQLIKLAHARAADVAADLAPLLGEVKVAADEASNALLVLAPPRDVAALRAIVDEMDRPRRQIYLEALVLEVESGTGRELGVAWHGGKPRRGGTYVGGLSSEGLSSVLPKDALAGGGLLGGLIGVPLRGSDRLFGTTIPSIGLLVRASAYSNRLDVLASPHLLTLDNHKATISVGENIPYKSSSGGATTVGTTLPPNIERQKVALTLEVTPHVADGDVIRLDLQLESSQLGNEDFGDDLGPTWKERTIETSVVLRDQESVVLGGLVDERIEDRMTGVPILSAIPVLGALFRTTERYRMKSNLLVILTPHLIDDTTAGREVLARRMRERDEFLRAASDLERRVLAPRLDYRKKRGLLAEIDAAVEEVEREQAARARAVRPTVPAGRIE